MPAYTMIESEKYTVTAEETDEGRILHMQVHGVWTKETKHQCYYDLARLHLAFGNLQAVAAPEDTKLKKFLGVLGFEYDRSIENYTGKLFDFYVRSVPNRS